MKPQTPDNEVARLRELLKRVMQTGVAHYTSYCFERCICGAESVQEDIQDELARLAPAPEEPVSLDPTPKFTHEGDMDVKVKQPEWRELGPDEVIQEGDEVQPKHHNRKGAWIWIWSHEVGATPRDQEAMRYRTRRPLPVQEEAYHWPDFCTCKKCKPKQDEMPLDVIEKHANSTLAQIQKLKENAGFARENQI